MSQINESHVKAVVNGQRPKAIAEKMADIMVRKVKSNLAAKRQSKTPDHNPTEIQPNPMPGSPQAKEKNGIKEKLANLREAVSGYSYKKIAGPGKNGVDDRHTVTHIASGKVVSTRGATGTKHSPDATEKDKQAAYDLFKAHGLRPSPFESVEESRASTKPAPVTAAIDKLAAKYSPFSVNHHTQATGHHHTVVVFKPGAKTEAEKFRKAVGTMGWTSSEGKEHDKDVTVIVNHKGINEAQIMFLQGFLHEDADKEPLDYAYAVGKALAKGHDLEEAWKNATGKRSGAWHPFLTVPAPGGMWMNIVRKTGQHIGGLFRNRVQARQAADSMATRMTANAGR
jgi:hypothetical protein